MPGLRLGLALRGEVGLGEEVVLVCLRLSMVMGYVLWLVVGLCLWVIEVLLWAGLLFYVRSHYVIRVEARGAGQAMQTSLHFQLLWMPKNDIISIINLLLIFFICLCKCYLDA